MIVTPDSARKIIKEIINLYPNVETALNYDNYFQLLIAVLLSAQTTDVAVNKVTPALFNRFPSPESFAEATPEEIAPYIQSIGLYRNKSKYIQQCCRDLMDKYNGQVPQTRKQLESLAGVGRKTANVVLSVAFDQPAFAVDTHVARVLKHHHIVPEDANVRQIEDYIVKILEPELLKQAHQSLIYFGRNVCHPRNPQCECYPQLYEDIEFQNQ